MALVRALMGCDIHAYVEYKRGEHYETFASDVDLDRNYLAFALMAGVRNYFDDKLGIRPVIAPRGFPDNAAWRTKDAFEEWGIDAHTPSLLTLPELGAVAREYESIASKMEGYAQDLEYQSLRPVQAMMRELKDARLVFWFDN